MYPMELIVGNTSVRCYEDGHIERFHKKNKKWQEVKGVHHNGYLTIKIEGKMYGFHRLIYKAYHREWVDSQLKIDHINRIRNDNRLENLRLVTHQQNMFNTDAKGYHLKGNGFESQITLNGEIFKKRFKTEDEARAWYLEQKEILHII